MQKAKHPEFKYTPAQKKARLAADRRIAEENKGVTDPDEMEFEYTAKELKESGADDVFKHQWAKILAKKYGKTIIIPQKMKKLTVYYFAIIFSRNVVCIYIESESWSEPIEMSCPPLNFLRTPSPVDSARGCLGADPHKRGPPERWEQ